MFRSGSGLCSLLLGELYFEVGVLLLFGEEFEGGEREV